MILASAKNLQAYLKMGFYGNAGSGKTYTATSVAIGLHKYIKSTKPISFLDTETGLDFMLPRLKKANIEVLSAKTRAFLDLIAVTCEAKEKSDILIIDSISHIWTELLAAYQSKTKKTRLSFQDWGILKPEWQRFTDMFLNTPLHIIICGRTQTIWDYFENEDGKMELYKAGTRMKAEGEMSYEPSLLVEMERVLIDDKKQPKGWIHRATILKDRASLIDGKEYDDPVFDVFIPHINALNIGGEHLGVDISRTSEDAFAENTGDTERRQRDTQRKAALEKIEACLLEKFPSTSAVEKRAKKRILEKVFGTPSWTEISSYDPDVLENGIIAIQDRLNNPDEIEKLKAD